MVNNPSKFKVKVGDTVVSSDNYEATVRHRYYENKKKRLILEFEWGDTETYDYYSVMNGDFYSPCISKPRSRLYTLYKRYDGIIQRCNNPNSTSYHRYGAMGIKCDFKSFDAFYRYVKTLDNYTDMLDNWEAFEIDRIDNFKGYCIGNIRIVTLSENQRNRLDNFRYNLIDMYTGEVIFEGIATDVYRKIKEITGCNTAIELGSNLYKWNIGLKNGFRLKVVPLESDRLKLHEVELENYLNNQDKYECYEVLDSNGNRLEVGKKLTVIKYIKNKFNSNKSIFTKNGDIRDSKWCRDNYGEDIKVVYLGKKHNKDIESIKYDLK
ncbi:MAG: hypothetical protein ACRDBY_04995 [Cetobacterium sp.]